MKYVQVEHQLNFKYTLLLYGWKTGNSDKALTNHQTNPIGMTGLAVFWDDEPIDWTAVLEG